MQAAVDKPLSIRFKETTSPLISTSACALITGLYVTGSQLLRLGKYYAQAVHEHYGDGFDVFFGPAYKGIPLSVAAAIAYSELLFILLHSLKSLLILSIH